MDRPAARDALTRGLSLAAEALDALRLWARAVDPRADLVATVDPFTSSIASALRRQGSGWLPVALPPVAVSRIPTHPTCVSLGDGRREAMDDLLFALGFDQVLLLPLEPREAGALLLARAGAPYASLDIVDHVSETAPLGAALARLARRRRADAPDGSAREVADLLDLARELSRVAGATAAARAGATCLFRLLDPACGAVLVRMAGEGAPAAIAWPDGPLAADAVTRAAAAAAMPLPEQIETQRGPHAGPARGATAAPPDHSVDWLLPAGSNVSVSIALAWPGNVPEPASRIATSVQASLTLALERLSDQRQREEDRLRAVVEGMPQGVVLVAPDDRVRLTNQSARDLLGRVRALAPRMPGETAPADERAERLTTIGSTDLAPLLAAARRGERAHAEIYYLEGGRTLELRAVPAAPSGRGGDPGRDVLLIIEDVTEARRQKAQLARSEKLSALGVLISGIIHEINNPLATIIGYSQMLAATPDAAQRDRWIGTVEEEAQRCQRIVGNLLTFARPREPGRAALSLAAVAERALSLVAHSFRAAGIEAVLRVGQDVPAVHADPDGVLQALINLLTNALHAMEAYAGPRHVQVEIEPDGAARVALSVADTGPGIAPEHLDRVFDPFFTTKPEGKGTGLGLSLVAAMVRDHGGTIEVDSAPGEGARFRILLPVDRSAETGAMPADSRDAPAAAAAPGGADGSSRPTAAGPGSAAAGQRAFAVTQASTGPQAAAPRPAAARSRGLHGARVLVVDDEPAVAGLLAEVLDDFGARCRTEPDPHRALREMLTDPPEAVVWDWSMSGLPGATLVAELRRRNPALLARVVFASGDAILPAVPGAEDGPAVLKKPFDLATVRDTLAGVVSKAQLEPIARPSPGDDPP
jgi:signal transduction histidine kinase